MKGGHKVPLSKDERHMLEKKAHELRNLCVDTVVWAGSGHIGGSLSAMDIFTLLYYKVMNLRVEEPDWEDRDRFILSKGHVGVGFAPVLADKGFFPKSLLEEYNHTGSPLGMHLDSLKVTGLDASTGSLGHGLPMALGMALSAKLRGKTYKTYCLMGDGECDEGSVWEAAMSINHYNTTNVITIVDRNRMMMDGPTGEVMKLEPFTKKWEAFGFHVMEVDGHDFDELFKAFEAVETSKQPVVIIANTIKGCGIKFMENNYRWHYGGLDSDKVKESKADLEAYYQKRLGEVL